MGEMMGNRESLTLGSGGRAAGAVLHVCAAVIRRGGRILLTSRPPGGHLAGMWEFPGGKKSLNETTGACVVRELREELTVEVIPLDLMFSTLHEYPTKTVYLEFYRALPACALFEPVPTEGQGMAWVDAGRLLEYDIAPADRPFAEFLSFSGK